MKRTGECRGTRDELCAELADAVTGWRHFGRPDLSEAVQQALDELREGADSVRVGHVTYLVTTGRQSATLEELQADDLEVMTDRTTE